MKKENLKQLAQEVINKDKWWDMLSRFIDVLRINIFMVDLNGLFILPPDRSRFGGRLLTDRSFGFDLLASTDKLLDQFISHNNFLETTGRYQLLSYAIPIKALKNQTIAYMIVGPVILNKRLEREEYTQMAKACGVNSDELVFELNELRVVSNMMIKSILELLSEIIKDHVDMTIKEKEFHKIKEERESQGKKFEEEANDIYSSVCVDELLVTLLDTALKMTNAECGSIMIADKEKGYLTVKASKGLDEKKFQDVRVKLGEGISGIAAHENRSFIIKGLEGDSRIKHLLKRSDIKESLVVPLKSKEGIVGVLNLSNKTQEGRFEEVLDSLRYLTTLVSSTL